MRIGLALAPELWSENAEQECYSREKSRFKAWNGHCSLCLMPGFYASQIV
jgi:hypothetical protein